MCIQRRMYPTFRPADALALRSRLLRIHRTTMSDMLVEFTVYIVYINTFNVHCLPLDHGLIG